MRRGRLAVVAVTPPWWRDPVRVCVLLLTVVTISRIHNLIPAVVKMRPALLLAALAIWLAVANRHGITRHRVLRTWPAGVVVGLGILACLSAPFGISLGNSGRFILEAYSKVLILTFLLMLTIRNHRDLSLYVWGYVASAGILVWISVFMFSLQAEGGTLRLGELYTYDTNDLALVLNVGFPLTLWIAETTKGTKRVVPILILLASAFAFARTGSRGGMVGLVAVGIGLFIFASHVSLSKKTMIGVAVLATIALAAPPGYWDRMETIMHPTQDYNWSARDGRREIFVRGLEYMWQHPVFGIGIGNFERAEGMISSKARDRVAGMGIRWASPHNSFVQAGAEMGLPGLLLWSSLPVLGIVGMFRLKRRLPGKWRDGTAEQRFLYFGTVYLPVALLGFAVSAFFLSFAYMPHIYILAAFMTGLYCLVNSSLRTAAAPGVRVRSEWPRRNS